MIPEERGLRRGQAKLYFIFFLAFELVGKVVMRASWGKPRGAV
jgi:hypothetical protein